MSKTSCVSGTVLTFGATWIFRWLTVDFTNDHFAHLSRARQILLGELPNRDFFDSGSLLHYYASAAALHLSGHNLLGEAILTVTAVAFAAALTFYLSARGSGSLIVATLAALITVALFPRLYNYPKLVLYPLTLLCVWRYAASRSNAALAMLAGVSAVSFLFRHDHGVYVSGAALTAVVLAHRDRVRVLPSAVVRFAVVIVVLLFPFVVFVQWSTGIVRYFSGIAAQGVNAATPRLLRLPFALDAHETWFTIDPPSRPRVSIRWHPDVDSSLRVERERRYGLTDRGSDGTYILTNGATANIKALVADPLVADTHNIDREHFRVIVRQSWLQQARNMTPLFRVRIGSNVFTSANILALLYYAIMLLPVVGLVTLAWAWRRGTLTGVDLTTIGTAVVMCWLINQGLIRESPDSRLPDVAGPAVILAAWITGVARRTPPVPAGRRRRVASRVAMGSAWLIVLWCAAIFGQAGERLEASGLLAGPRSAVGRFDDTRRTLLLRPIDWYAPVDSTGVRALTRYVLQCTRPSDRLLVAWFEPQIFFYAERPFAGGQTYLDPGWHSSTEDEALTVSRLRRQRVPIILTNAAMEAGFHSGFPLVHQYVVANYVETARSGFGTGGEYAVFVKRDVTPKGTYAPLNLPCYR
jgi:hypothetical protein